ncbi:MAG: zeta toxin family protein [Alphaproteobacteria bacterium]|nr:zeta toxin family protein [Alphaproteobacteria bacterium]
MPSLNKLVNKEYQSLKTNETEAIIASQLNGLKSSDTPVLLQVSGIPGAGKSVYCETHLRQNYLYLSFDKIMTSMQGYQQDLLQFGPEIAFKNYEMKARVIGYEVLNRAISNRFNIMLEHSGTNDAHLELFKNIKQKGYQTAVNFIMCDTNLAIKRAEKRKQEINRHVPEALIRERAQNFNFYIKAYEQLGSETKLFDGTNNFAVLKKI